jgi:hypothetical protein
MRERPTARSVYVDEAALERLIRATEAPSAELAVAIAISHFLNRDDPKGAARQIEKLFGTLRPEDWGDWDPAVGMYRSDPAYEETRRRKFGDDSELGSDE